MSPYGAALPSKVLASCHLNCTQERPYARNEGRLFGFTSGLVSFLSSTISHSDVNSRWSYLSSLPTVSASPNTKQSLSHNFW